MKSFSRRPMTFLFWIGCMLILSACSRSIAAPEEPAATPIDLSLEQTLTLVSLPEETGAAESLPENTAPPTPPPPQATETEMPQASETPSTVPATNEITEEPAESSTEAALSVTQTVTPVSVPPASVEAALQIAYLETAPVIDGDFADWPGVIYAIDKIVFGQEFYANQIDLFGEFKLGWDLKHLYLGVLVRDSRYVQTSTEALLFQGDSLELLLDTDRSADLASEELSADDYQIGFSAGNLMDVPLPEAYLWAPADREGALQSALVKGRLTDDGYMVEIALAWEELGVTPTAGMTLGFLLSVSDNDTLGKNEQQTVISISQTRNLTNPATWLPVMLAAP